MNVLLSPPPQVETDYDKNLKPIERIQGKYKPTYQRFVISSSDNQINRQFSHTFRRRLQAIGPSVKKNALDLWRSQGFRFAEQAVQISIGEKVAIVGIVTKTMAKMPDVLQELKAAERGIAADFEGESTKNDADIIVNYVSDSDCVILEDRSGRIALGGNIDANLIIPGAVMGFRGIVQDGPVLCVDACCFPEFAPQNPLPIITNNLKSGESILFVCGLQFGCSNFNLLKAKLLLDFVGGLLGGISDSTQSAAISRVIVAGNSLHAINLSELNVARQHVSKNEVCL